MLSYHSYMFVISSGNTQLMPWLNLIKSPHNNFHCAMGSLGTGPECSRPLDARCLMNGCELAAFQAPHCLAPTACFYSVPYCCQFASGETLSFGWVLSWAAGDVVFASTVTTSMMKLHPSIIQRPIEKIRTRALTLYKDGNTDQFSSPCKTRSWHKVHKWFKHTVRYVSDVTLCCSDLFENCSVASLAHFSWQRRGMHISRVWRFTRGTATL